MATIAKLTWATVDIKNGVEVDSLRKRESAEAAARVAKQIGELRALGIVDVLGRRVKKQLPEEMICRKSLSSDSE